MILPLHLTTHAEVRTRRRGGKPPEGIPRHPLLLAPPVIPVDTHHKARFGTVEIPSDESHVLVLSTPDIVCGQDDGTLAAERGDSAVNA